MLGQSSLRLVSFVSLGCALVACSVDVEDIFDTGNPATGGGSSNNGGSGTGAGQNTGAGQTAGGNGTGAGQTAGGNGTGAGQTAGGNGQGGNATGVCGDGVAQLGEECDGNDLNGSNCTTFGFVKPAGLSCTQGCAYDSSGCDAVCGNGTMEPGEGCDDGNTIPNDGCSPQCQAQGPTCQSATEINLALGTITVMGTTNGGSLEEPQQAQSCTSGAGPELVYRVTPTSNGFLTAYLPKASTTFDSVLYARASCDPNAEQPLCDDNFGGNDQGGEVISFPVVANVPIYIFVDGFQTSDKGQFTLSLDLSAGGNCGDPVPIVVEGQGDLVLLGDTSPYSNDGSSNFQCNNSGGGPDVMYEVTTANGGAFSFDLTPTGNPQHNTVLHARTSCGDQGTQIDCDSPFNTNDSALTLDLAGGATNSVWVDGTSNQSGPYRLTISH